MLEFSAGGGSKRTKSVKVHKIVAIVGAEKGLTKIRWRFSPPPLFFCLFASSKRSSNLSVSLKNPFKNWQEWVRYFGSFLKQSIFTSLLWRHSGGEWLAHFSLRVFYFEPHEPGLVWIELWSEFSWIELDFELVGLNNELVRIELWTVLCVRAPEIEVPRPLTGEIAPSPKKIRATPLAALFLKKNSILPLRRTLELARLNFEPYPLEPWTSPTLHEQPRQIQPETPEMLTCLTPTITPFGNHGVRRATLFFFFFFKNSAGTETDRAVPSLCEVVSWFFQRSSCFFCRHRWCANTLVGEETLVEALLNCTGGQRALEGKKQFLGLWPFRLRLRTWRFGHDCRTDNFSDQRPKAPEKKIRFFHTLLTTSNAEGRPSKWYCRRRRHCFFFYPDIKRTKKMNGSTFTPGPKKITELK